MSNKKIGRPSDEPKPNKVDTRISDEDLKHLDEYCVKHKKTKAEALREAIKALKI